MPITELVHPTPPGYTNPTHPEYGSLARVVTQARTYIGNVLLSVSETTALQAVGTYLQFGGNLPMEFPTLHFAALVYAVIELDANAGEYDRGALLAQGDEVAVNTSAPVDWHDLPIAVTLEPGQKYIVGFKHTRALATVWHGDEWSLVQHQSVPSLGPLFEVGPFTVWGGHYGWCERRFHTGLTQILRLTT